MTCWHYMTAMDRLVVPLSILCMMISTSAAARTDPTESQPPPLPILTWKAEMADYVRALDDYSRYHSRDDSALLYLRNFRGLLIEHNEVRELHPFLPSIFFETGSADIAGRYQVFGDGSHIPDFGENRIPGGTLQKHYQIMNILGSRMQRNPKTTITLVGCSSQQAEHGETRRLSQQRAEAVRDYLVTMWDIAPKRIRTEARDLPEHPSDNDNEKGREENRRVEIVSTDHEIIDIISQFELRRFPQPETVTFGMKNGIADDEVASRRIEIRRNGEIWHLMDEGMIELTNAESPEYNWGRNGNEDIIPEDEAPYVAQLIVRSKSGVEYRSEAVEIPVKIITQEEKIRDRLIDRTIDRYSLVRFDFNSSRLDPLNDRILRQFICDSVPDSSRITVVGYATDREKFAMILADGRGEEVVKLMKRYVQEGKIMSIEIGGRMVGTLYTNALPEGRCLNRTVQVMVESPTGRHRYEAQR